MEQSTDQRRTYCDPCEKGFKSPDGYDRHMELAYAHADDKVKMKQPEPASSPTTPTALEGIDAARVLTGIEDMVTEFDSLKQTVMAQSQHAPGLCDASDCRPCVESKRGFVRRSVATFQQDLQGAADYFGHEELVDKIVNSHAEWVKLGRPKREPRKYLEIDGTKITA